MKLVNIVHFSKEKSCLQFIDITVEPYEEYFKTSFFKVNESYIHCSTTEGGADQNRMAVDVRGAAVKTFHFAEVINK